MKFYYEENKLVWVAPSCVNYSREHMEILLPWLLEMQEGVYPAEPTGKADNDVRSGIRSHAYFEASCQVAAEIDRRLARTGTDHYLVIDYYCKQIQHDDLARQNHMSFGEVISRISNAMSYISSGQCPRWLACEDCGDFNRCRRKKKGERVAVEYKEYCWYRSRERSRRKRVRHEYTKIVCNT